MKQKGFTLAELLIALAILGVIATFTIPKVLSSQQANSYSSAAKEAFGAASGAFSSYQANNTVGPATSAVDLTSYFNYVAYDTSSLIDSYQNDATVSNQCGNTNPCLKLHNGALMRFSNSSFSGTTSTHAIWFEFDPDGKVTDGTTNGPGRCLKFAIYANGRLATRSTITNPTYSGASTYGPVAGSDPPWFSWN